MNMIAENLVPNDEQLYCYHIVGMVTGADGRIVLINRDNADLLKSCRGYYYQYCPLCGGRLEELQ
jgi:hypothetical protein